MHHAVICSTSNRVPSAGSRSGYSISSTPCTTLISLARVRSRCALFNSSGDAPFLAVASSLPNPKSCSSASRWRAVRDSIECMLASVRRVAWASGRSCAGTSSGGCQDDVEERVVESWFGAADEAAVYWRRRTSMRAANISPVPEKNTGREGTVMQKMRGVRSEEDKVTSVSDHQISALSFCSISGTAACGLISK